MQNLKNLIPGVEVVVSLIDGLGHLFHAGRVVLLINGDQLLRELIELLDLMLVLVELGVERLQASRGDEIKQVGKAVNLSRGPLRVRPSKTRVPLDNSRKLNLGRRTTLPSNFYTVVEKFYLNAARRFASIKLTIIQIKPSNRKTCSYSSRSSNELSLISTRKGRRRE